MIAKVAILFAALAAVHANVLLGGHGHLVNTGVSTSSRIQDVSLRQQCFRLHHQGWTWCHQLPIRSRRCPWKQEGSYTIADIDGRARRVDYVADGHGFRATVKTNEPGTAASAPAAALIASPYAGPVAPVVNHVAPAVAVGHAASYAAPLAVAAPVAYGGVIGHGAALGLGAPLGLGYGAGLGLGHGAGLGLGYGAGLGLAHGGALGLGYGLGLGKDSKQLHMTTIIKLSAQIETPNMPFLLLFPLSSSVDLTFKTHNKSPFCKMGTLLQPFYFIM
ncbi:hypothetical protein CEXT_669101 [Caerostris extrusa]|uniref:Cuticle protein n=1 Tax=Caerostris extrusa TaxID=172846 RepID=A0AAV4TBW7_CAEEX|nr:hypothetical protein CEXT_669101 [Caerostris extrusa]